MENIFTEFCDLQALFEGEHWETADTTVITKKDKDLELNKYFEKRMIPSDLVSPTKKFEKRSKDKDGAKFNTLLSNEKIFTNNGYYQNKDFQEACGNYFDINDRYTREVLCAVNEEDQSKLLASLTSKLYEEIIGRVDEVDFGDIPNSKGDITKLKNYDKIVNCIDIMEKLLKEYHQKPDAVLIVKAAVDNVRRRKNLFERGYHINAEMPMLVYNTITLSIISSISYLIATCIEFIKRPGKESFAVVLDSVAYTKAKDSILFSNLEKFNLACAKGQIDTALDGIVKTKVKKFTGLELGLGFFGSGVALVVLVLGIIPIMRELIYFFYYSRTRVAEYFDMQADMLQMNAHNIKVAKKEVAGKDRDKVIERQMKLVDLFRKISSAIEVDAKTAEVQTAKEVINTQKKYKVNDITDEIPDSAAASGSVLF